MARDMHSVDLGTISKTISCSDGSMDICKQIDALVLKPGGIGVLNSTSLGRAIVMARSSQPSGCVAVSK